MAGPTAGVLLRRVLSDKQIATIKEWRQGIAKFDDESASHDITDGWEFFPEWPTSLGTEPERHPCLTGLTLRLSDPADFASPNCEWTSYRAALGWMPACELGIWMGCNQPQDHKLLAWLCVELAETFNGMIDLGGPLPMSGGENAVREKIPGTILEEFYYIDEGRVGISHIVDPEFLRFWLKQPQFHMIK